MKQNILHKLVPWKVDNSTNLEMLEHSAWVKNLHDAIDTDILVETIKSSLLLQVSEVTWKKVLDDKNENSESEYMFQYDFFFLYFNQKWKCYFLMSFKIYNTVFKYRHSLSMEAANLNKWTKWSFVLRLDLQFKNSGLVLMSYDF